MNKQIIIMLVAACTTALWGIVHSSQASMTTNQIPNTMTMVPTTVAHTMQQTTSTNLPALAQSHFENIDASAVENILNEAKELTAKFKIHAEIETVYLNHIRAAFEAGLRVGLMSSGQYMQAGLTAMGNRMKAMTAQPTRPMNNK